MVGLSRDDVWMADLDAVGGVAVPRRRRSAVERRRVVEETFEAGASVARVALKHGINANQLFQWRRLYRDGRLGAVAQGRVKLLPVSVAEELEPPKAGPVEVVSRCSGAIHIELPGEIRISLEGSVDPAIVCAVLRSLRS
jgi:transposase